MDVSRAEAADMRIRRLRALVASYDALTAQKELSPMSLAAIGIWKNDCREEIDYLKAKRQLTKAQQEGRITDEMISIAKSYPITSLIDFNKGVALAWCHADKNPSLTYWAKANRAKCWACNKSFSSIDVMMELHGMSFVDAVKFLQ
jgi:hypothetical protein